jgi:hypothetical protein
MAEPKGIAQILAEDLAQAPKPKGFDEYVEMLRLNTPRRIKPPAIKQSPENLMSLDELKGVTDKLDYLTRPQQI